MGVADRIWDRPESPLKLVRADSGADSDRAPIKVVYLDDVHPQLDSADFVQGLLIAGSMVVCYGQSNSGKTFWCSDLALHAAAGMRWSDRAVEQVGVIWVAMEGSHGIFNRVSAWRDHYRLSSPIHFAIIPTALNLLDRDADTQPLIETIKAVAATMGVKVGLVVIDTLSRAIAGGNENSPEDMGLLVSNGDAIRSATEACVLWIHHSGKDDAKGARGHSLLRAATDTEIEISEAEGGDRLALVRKQRELPRDGSFQFTLKVIELGVDRRGAAVTSCVVVHSLESAGAALPGTRLRGHTKRAFDVLSTLIASEGKTGGAQTPDFTPSIPETWWRDRFYDGSNPGDLPEAKRKAFQRATKELINDRGVVGMGGGRVWIIRQKSDSVT